MGPLLQSSAGMDDTDEDGKGKTGEGKGKGLDTGKGKGKHVGKGKDIISLQMTKGSGKGKPMRPIGERQPRRPIAPIGEPANRLLLMQIRNNVDAILLSIDTDDMGNAMSTQDILMRLDNSQEIIETVFRRLHVRES